MPEVEAWRTIRTVTPSRVPVRVLRELSHGPRLRTVSSKAIGEKSVRADVPDRAIGAPHIIPQPDPAGAAAPRETSVQWHESSTLCRVIHATGGDSGMKRVLRFGGSNR